MFSNRSVNVHQFAMVPRADVPRSAFRMQKALKTSFDAGYLVPCMVEEVLPGDTFNLKMTAFARLSTPIFPFMDNLHFETFFFFVPNRLVWDNWQRFMGERDPDPTSSIDYLIPECRFGNGSSAWPVGSLGDYFGLPIDDQWTGTANWRGSALPFRGYNLIWNEWFRDQNLQNSAPVFRDDGPDDVVPNLYVLRKRGKRHDYFTSCLPFVQKGNPVTLPLGTSAPVIAETATAPFQLRGATNSVVYTYSNQGAGAINNALGPTPGAGGVTQVMHWPTEAQGGTNLIADLSTATAATINQIRQAFQVQRLLERDARGGSRYTEIVRAHFGVISPDARLQRPEYLGGGYSPININPVAQTAPTEGTSPQGNLAAFGTMLARDHGFTQSFTEHGYIIGLMSVRADLTYQQGMRRHWSRRTRYDFYFPAFANLGEQAVLNKEIFMVGTNAQDDAVFGYQERWAEYRYNPSEITGLMRSTAPGTIDAWHLAQRFTSLPVLNASFIEENPPLERVLAVGAAAGGQQLLLDAFFDIKAVRPMPLYSVPGLIDHF